MSDERDSQLDRALARHLRNASSDAFCPDAEILAAYHERTLSSEEMARWKDHIAVCGSCREALALIEQTESVTNPEWKSREVPVYGDPFRAPKPTPVAAPRSAHGSVPAQAPEAIPAGRQTISAKTLPPRRALGWLLPVGALAAAILVWVGVREGKRAEPTRMEVAENQATTPMPSPPVSQSQSPASKDEPKTKAALSADQAVSPEVAYRSATTDAKKQKEETARIFEERRQKLDSLAAESQLSSDSENQPATSAAGGVAAKSAPEAPQISQQSPAPHSPGARYAPKYRDDGTRESASKNMVISPLTAQAYPSAAALRKIATGDPSVVLAPDGQQVWVVRASGELLHSGDGGRTWEVQKTGVAFDLVTGAAPSSQVVWVVGKSGTILLTTDAGAHWMKLKSPIAGDLGSVRASDATHVTISDAAHQQSFLTSDGGATWQPVANP